MQTEDRLRFNAILMQTGFMHRLPMIRHPGHVGIFTILRTLEERDDTCSNFHAGNGILTATVTFDDFLRDLIELLAVKR